MSWTDDEIDALFKEIPTQHKPSPFQDSFFDEIEHLLPKKRKNKGLFWVFGSTLLVALTSTFVFIYSGSSTEKTELANAAVNDTENQNPGNVKTQHVASQSQSQGIYQSQRVSQQTTNNTESLLALEEQAKNEFALNVITPVKNQNTETVKTQHVASHWEVASEDQENLAASQGPLSEEVSPEETSQDEASRKQESQDENLAEINPASENTSENENSRPEFISPLITSDLNLLAVTFFNTDSEKQIQALYLPMLNRKHFLTLETGLGFTENFIKMENSSQKPMPTASLGLSYQYRNKGFFYSAGFNWMNFSPNSLNLTRESKVYGFDTKHYSQKIDYQWITMVEMPLSVGKRFKNSSFTLGVSPALVLGSMVDFTKTQNGEITQKSTIYGNMLGLKQYAASVNFAYDLHIARNLDLGVKVSNMLLNPLDDTKFIGQLNKNPFQAQVTLKKHFRIR